MSAYFGQVSNGFSEGKKLVACFLKSKPLILKSGPLIFSLLLCGFNGVKISFHIFCPKTDVLQHRFLHVKGVLCGAAENGCFLRHRVAGKVPVLIKCKSVDLLIFSVNYIRK